MKSLVNYSVAELSKLLSRGEITSVEITKAYLHRIAEVEPDIGAYITTTPEEALTQAALRDQSRPNESMPLWGIPMAVKDNINVAGFPATCASNMLKKFVPGYSATAYLRMEAVGCPFLGKTNMDEFSMGSTTENSAFHSTKNPWDLARVPGGSSGGSAAAVAALEAPFALGSDTGGSIRQPAAFCGVVGMKPTYGAVSRYGLTAFASSLDQIGPLAKTTEDCALIMDALAGHDPKDATSRAFPHSCLEGIGRDIKGLRLALPKEFFGEGLAPDVRSAVEHAAHLARSLGVEVLEVSLPSLKDALPAYYVISSAEASSNLSRFDGIRYGYRSPDSHTLDELYKNSRSQGFGPEVQRRILLGTFALSSGYYDAYYKKAQAVREKVMAEYDAIFTRCDAILSPVAPTTAYPLGEKGDDPLAMYLGDIYTVPVNIAGLPAVSIPCGVDALGLPIGLQLAGPAFSEPRLLIMAHALEQSLQFHKHHSPKGVPTI